MTIRFSYKIILLLAGLALFFAACERQDTVQIVEPVEPLVETAEPQVFEIPKPVLEAIISTAAQEAQEIAADAYVDHELNKAYAPVYEAITEYAQFHYSLLGSYVETAEVLSIKQSKSVNEILFKGFDARLTESLLLLEERYNKHYEEAFYAQLTKTIPAERLQSLSPSIREELQTVVRFIRTLSPLAKEAVSISAGLVSSKIAQRIAKKYAAGALARIASKGALAAGGFAGFTLCSPGVVTGPACTIGAGLGLQIATDYGIIWIDKLLYEDQFKADIRTLIDEDKAAKKRHIEEVLQKKTDDIEMKKDEILEDFVLSYAPS